MKIERVSKYTAIILGVICLFLIYRTKANDTQLQSANPAVKAFSSALGFGAFSLGGSGRLSPTPRTSLIAIDNLNEDGPGSLRHCVESKGPRTCVFETSGVIKLTNPLVVKEPFLTLAGQTAPDPGILIRGAGLIVETHDVIVRHLSIRVGDDSVGPDPSSRGGITVLGKSDSYNLLFDHLTIAWALDENINTWYRNVHDITFSNCIIAEGLNNSLHPKGPHSKGILIGEGSKRISLIRNILAHNSDSNPNIHTGTSVEFVNNVVYGWGGKSSASLINISDSAQLNNESEVDIVGNIFKPAPDSLIELPVVFAKPISRRTRIFVADNTVFLSPTSNSRKFLEDQWQIIGVKGDENRSISPLLSSEISGTVPSEAALDLVLKNAGARPRKRTEIDRRLIEDIINGTGTLVDCVEGCAQRSTGWVNYEVNKKKFSLPPDYAQVDPESGLTGLEKKLDDIATSLE